MFLRLKYAVILIPLLVGACSAIWSTVEVEEVDPTDAESMVIRSPVRAYLADGSVVVLSGGALVNNNMLRGEGTRHSLTLAQEEAFREVLLDSVVAVEAFEERRKNQAASLVLSLSSASAIVYLALLFYAFVLFDTL